MVIPTIAFLSCALMFNLINQYIDVWNGHLTLLLMHVIAESLKIWITINNINGSLCKYVVYLVLIFLVSV